MIYSFCVHCESPVDFKSLEALLIWTSDPICDSCKTQIVSEVLQEDEFGQALYDLKRESS